MLWQAFYSLLDISIAESLRQAMIAHLNFQDLQRTPPSRSTLLHLFDLHNVLVPGKNRYPPSVLVDLDHFPL